MIAAAPRVAYQGAPGAFSEEAGTALFPDRKPALVPMRDFAGVLAAVTGGSAEYGVLPIENSIYGSVMDTYDLLGAGTVAIIGEVVHPIRHYLLAPPGATTDRIARVISHPVALAQCGRFLTLTGAVVEACYDTAGAAQEVAAAGDRTAAAIASRSAAERYGLAILAADIQDRPDNATRFLLVAPRAAAEWPAGERHGSWKAVLLLEAEHRPGALVSLLLPFAARGINLTRIESRPADRVWTYRFFVELITADGLTGLDAAMDEVRTRAARVLVLGCFRVASPAATA